MRWLTVPSPVGDLIAVADGPDAGSARADGHDADGAGAGGSVLCRLDFDPTPPPGPPSTDDPTLTAAAGQLAEYFAGRRTEFDLPLRPAGSVFERAVWAELARIPYAQTRSYGDIARAVTHDVGASRAVGIANNHNPIPIIVPCHRVVGANRKLVGYGGGLHRKRFLLELEARVQFTAGGLLSG